MKVAYIVGKYRSKTIEGTRDNIGRARKTAIKYWKKGYAVICPHLNTALFDGLADDEVWLKGDQEILKRCDVIIMMRGWKKSVGAKSEYQLAKRLRKQIIFE